MSVFVIENNGGQYAHVGPVVIEWTSYACATVFENKESAEKFATAEDKIVPLIPESELKAGNRAEPEEVTEEEAQFVDSLSGMNYPLDALNKGLYRSFIPTSTGQHHLLRAIRNGWYIPKPSHFFLPMDGTQMRQNDGLHQSYAFIRHGVWTTGILPAPVSSISSKHKYNYTVTDAEIEKAPTWVKGLEKVELDHDSL